MLREHCAPRIPLDSDAAVSAFYANDFALFGETRTSLKVSRPCVAHESERIAIGEREHAHRDDPRNPIMPRATADIVEPLWALGYAVLFGRLGLSPLNLSPRSRKFECVRGFW